MSDKYECIGGTPVGTSDFTRSVHVEKLHMKQTIGEVQNTEPAGCPLDANSCVSPSDLAYFEFASGPVHNPKSTEFAELCRMNDCRSWGYRFLKRSFDIVFSGIVCALGLIPGAILAIAIAVDTKGAPIYSQERIGRCGKAFHIYKFRSMVADADKVEKYLSPDQLRQWKMERKVDNDPRVTRLGRALRVTSIDEIPQFFNVLCGDISILGPRPITYQELRWFGADASVLLSVPPGITGAWQCGPRNEATFENGRRQRIELDYVKDASVRKDVRIFFKTFVVMFLKRTGR